MQQTMYIIVALMIFSLYVFSQQRRAIDDQTTMVNNTVEVLSNGVAVERLSKIRSLSFDQATEETFINSSTALTMTTEFGPSQDAENDDIDDFDGASQDIYRYLDTDSLGFRVESTVAYADENDPSTEVIGSSRTKYKKVTVKVYSLDVAEADTVQISQTISCKSACNW